MNKVMLEHMKILLERHYLENDFVFRAIFSVLLEDGVFTKEELADKLLVSVPSIERWSRGRNLPMPAIRTSILIFLKSELDKKFTPS